MNFNNEELIPNKTILSFGNWENMELDSFLLSVTRGMATSEQKHICYQKFMEELTDDEIGLNHKYFESENNFELWCDNELIGLCQNEVSVQDWKMRGEECEFELLEKDKETLFLFCNLEAVFILQKFRGKGLGSYFSETISESQTMQMFGLLSHQKRLKISSVEVTFFSDYNSKEGELFHQSLYSDNVTGYVESILINLGFTYEVFIEADY